MRHTKPWQPVPLLLAMLIGAAVEVGCRAEKSDAGPPGGPADDASKSSNRVHNLAHLKCPTPASPGKIDIEVAATKDVLVDPEDAVLFACEDDAVRWFAKDKTLKITVALEGENAEELFKGGETILTSSAGETVPQLINVHAHAAVHKYSIKVVESNGARHRVDPHVIPMGK